MLLRRETGRGGLIEMRSAIKVRCRIVEKRWLTPTVLAIRFEPSKSFAYEAGQFLSLYVPSRENGAKPLRRIYSFASPSKDQGYELCVKLTGGPGTSYLASLEPGQEFEATAPYGHFLYKPVRGRSACFIATGTGIAPLRSMALSRAFAEQPPESALVLFGARAQDEIIYPNSFEPLGIQVVNALSAPGPGWGGFRGRVTDYLRSLPSDWAWHTTDFYLCGNGDMIAEVRKILVAGRGVPVSAIHQEAYFSPSGQPVPIPIKIAA